MIRGGHKNIRPFRTVNILGSSILIISVTAAVAPASGGRPAINHGMALGDLWEASAAEYQASAEAHLERVRARNIQTADPVGSMLADFLRIFAGGGGAPQDLVRPRADGVMAE